MKKILLSSAFASLIFLSASAQQCPTSVNSNAGGSNSCPNTEIVNGVTYYNTGVIRLNYGSSAAVPPCYPKIVQVQDQDGVLFGGYVLNPFLLPNGTGIGYCAYSTAQNDNYFNKQNLIITYKFPVSCVNGQGSTDSVFITCADNIPLPVKFSSFTATRSNSSAVAINWTTASESNNKGFNVQKYVNGEWKTIAFVFSQTTNGTSSSALSYSYTDQNNEKGITQYRIQQVDLDGKFAYSDIRAIRGDGSLSKLVVYPNPSTDGKVNVVFEDNLGVRDVQVSDMQGKVIRSFKGVTNNILVIERLTSGFYTIKVTNRTTSGSSVQKVVIK